ncbi:Hypothetical protein POVR1_LOCUS493 [uncultured virus]|nr:Hypothetical protein POVR1_LOCUS493 [uncultured virus]
MWMGCFDNNSTLVMEGFLAGIPIANGHYYWAAKHDNQVIITILESNRSPGVGEYSEMFQGYFDAGNYREAIKILKKYRVDLKWYWSKVFKSDHQDLINFAIFQHREDFTEILVQVSRAGIIELIPLIKQLATRNGLEITNEAVTSSLSMAIGNSKMFQVILETFPEATIDYDKILFEAVRCKNLERVIWAVNRGAKDHDNGLQYCLDQDEIYQYLRKIGAKHQPQYLYRCGYWMTSLRSGDFDLIEHRQTVAEAAILRESIDVLREMAALGPLDIDELLETALEGETTPEILQYLYDAKPSEESLIKILTSSLEDLSYFLPKATLKALNAALVEEAKYDEYGESISRLDQLIKAGANAYEEAIKEMKYRSPYLKAYLKKAQLSSSSLTN